MIDERYDTPDWAKKRHSPTETKRSEAPPRCECGHTWFLHPPQGGCSGCSSCTEYCPPDDPMTRPLRRARARGDEMSFSCHPVCSCGAPQPCQTPAPNAQRGGEEYYAEDVAREVALLRRFVERNAQRDGGYNASAQEVVAASRILDALQRAEAERNALDRACDAHMDRVREDACTLKDNDAEIERLTAELAQARADHTQRVGMEARAVVRAERAETELAQARELARQARVYATPEEGRNILASLAALAPGAGEEGA